MKNQTKEFADRRKLEVKLLNAIESLGTRSSVLNSFMNKDPKHQRYKTAKKQYLDVLDQIASISKTLRASIDRQEIIAIKKDTRDKLREANIEAFKPKNKDEDEDETR